MSLRDLPSVDRLLQHEQAALLVETFGRDAVLNAIRGILDDTRQVLLKNGEGAAPDENTLLQQIAHRIESQFQTSLRRVINATGVILHTNLGRAPMSEAAVNAVQAATVGYTNLEFDLSSGKRGGRQTHIEDVAAQVIGAESAMVVNNAAAAVLLTLSALARGREVVISRGQLVEVGGGFRIPDVMAQSGAHLVEVGTTNRTRLTDYANAITENTALLMRAHASNFQILGFTEEVALPELASLAHERGLLCVDDLGSGALLDTAAFGLRHEPTAQESLAANVDAVVFSGDKLLGGPQAGIIVGKRSVLDDLKTHPLARALRVDKMTIVALVATLDHYRRGAAVEHIPIWQMIAKPMEKIQKIAEEWSTAINGEIVAGESTVGGGSLPGETLPTVLFSPHVASAQLAQERLRGFDPPIIARVKDDRLLLDPRTVFEAEIPSVTQALQQL